MASKEEIAAVYKRGYENPVFFCRTFLSEWFSTPMPWVHRGVLAILLERTDFLLEFGPETWETGACTWDAEGLDKILRHFVWRENPEDALSPERPVFVREGNRLVLMTTDLTLILMPRGFSKTTLVNASNLWSIVYAVVRFILYISEAAPHAEGQLQNIKIQLETNEKLIVFYGNLVPERNDPKKWRDDYIETLNGVAVAARGRGGQIRGLLRNGRRPDRIIVDDVEDEDSVLTEDSRHKTRTWFWRTVMPALPKVQARGRLVAIGNMLHADGLLPNLARDPAFLTMVFGATDRDGDALWEANMSLKKLESTKRSYLLAGELSGFYLEYFNSIRNEDASVFSAKNVRYQIMVRTDFVGVSEVIDPAISPKKEADFCAIAVAGMTEKGQIHCLDMWGKKGASPREQVDEYFKFHFLWRPTHHGVESIAYQASLIHLLQEEMFRKSKEFRTAAYFEITPITHSKEKIARIKGVLAPRYRSGYVTHQKRFPELESQLFDFPNGKVDFPDALAMAVTLLDPYAGMAGDADQLVGDEYPDIEEVLGGSYGDAP